MHLRCPHCHNPIDVLNDQPLHDVSCPSCGSNFNLISGGETQTHNDAGRSLGHFQLIEQLGCGQFGSVWKARDVELDRVVAIKIPRKKAAPPQSKAVTSHRSPKAEWLDAIAADQTIRLQSSQE